MVAGQSIITLTAELKRQALLSDFPALNRMIAEKSAEHQSVRSASEERLEKFSTTLDQVHLLLPKSAFFTK